MREALHQAAKPWYRAGAPLLREKRARERATVGFSFTHYQRYPEGLLLTFERSERIAKSAFAASTS